MGQHRDEQPVVVVERGSGIGAFLSGAALGAIVALLLAPQSGEETRTQLRARARRLREAAEDRLDDIQDAVETGYEKTKASIEAGLQRARRNIEERRDDAKDAVGAGKAAVRSARDELERRLADARAERGQGQGRGDDAEADE
jgi:gas vesicle protein